MGRRTLFENVHALDSGQTLTYRDGDLRERRYYDFTRTAVMDETEVSTEKLASLFTEAVRRRIRPDTTNTVLLSGGFDSRLILGTLTNLGVTPKLVTLENANYSPGAADGS